MRIVSILSHSTKVCARCQIGHGRDRNLSQGCVATVPQLYPCRVTDPRAAQRSMTSNTVNRNVILSTEAPKSLNHVEDSACICRHGAGGLAACGPAVVACAGFEKALFSAVYIKD